MLLNTKLCHGCVSVRGGWTHSPNCAPHSNERSPLHLTLEAWTVTGRRHAVCVIAQGGLKGCWEPGNSESLRNFGIGCTMYIQLAGWTIWHRGFSKYSQGVPKYWNGLSVCSVIVMVTTSGLDVLQIAAICGWYILKNLNFAVASW